MFEDFAKLIIRLTIERKEREERKKRNERKQL